MRLAELQRLFVAQLTDSDVPADRTWLEQLARDRTQVYRGNMIGAQISALEAVFPILGKILGSACLGAILHDFASQHPYLQRDLSGIGQAFPEWLGDLQRTRPELADFAYLADLARLELAHDQAQLAPDSRYFDFAGFQRALAEKGAEAIVLLAAPSLRLLSLRWPVDKLWAAQLNDEPTQVREEPPPIRLAILRQGLEILHLRLDEETFRMLQSARKGAPLSQLAETGRPNLIADMIQLGAIDSFAVPGQR